MSVETKPARLVGNRMFVVVGSPSPSDCHYRDSAALKEGNRSFHFRRMHDRKHLRWPDTERPPLRGRGARANRAFVTLASCGPLGLRVTGGNPAHPGSELQLWL